jgi:hypothetical protein
MWPLFPKCGPDVRLHCKDSGNVVASSLGLQCFSPDGEASIQMEMQFLDLKNKNKKGWIESLREMELLCSFPKAFMYIWIFRPPFISKT